MTVGSIRTVSPSGGVDYQPARPREITKAGLASMRDRTVQVGGVVPAGLDALIEKFDQAAGRSGKMTFAQFTSFAAENGVTVPEPGKGGPQRGAPPRGTPPASAPAGGGTPASSSASTDVSSETDAQLMIRAARGDTKAIQELGKRESAKTVVRGTPSAYATASMTGEFMTGQVISAYA